MRLATARRGVFLPISEETAKAAILGGRFTRHKLSDREGRLECGMLCFILWCMFKDALIEHFRNPHNAGELPDATATAEVTNPVCGDVMRLAVRVEGGRIAAARFKTQGCVAAIASSSVLTDMLGGKTCAEARKITPEQISSALGDLPPATFHAAQLCTDAVAVLLAKLPR